MIRLVSALCLLLSPLSLPSLALGESLLEIRAQTILEDPIFQEPIFTSSTPAHKLALVGRHKQFSVVKYKEFYYAVRSTEKEIDPFELGPQNWPDLSADGIRLKIDHFLATENKDRRIRDTHRLDSYKGFNIIEFGNKYYGISRSEGRVNFSNKRDWTYPWFIALSINKVKEQIDRAYLLKTFKQLPSNPQIMIQQGYKGFNIIQSYNIFYGIDQRNGEIDVEEINNALFPFVQAKTLDEVKSKIDKLALTISTDKAVFRVSTWLRNKLSTWLRKLAG